MVKKTLVPMIFALGLLGCGNSSEENASSVPVAPANTSPTPSVPQNTGTAAAPVEDPNSDASQGGLEQVNPGQAGSRD